MHNISNVQIAILSFFLLATVLTAAACPGFRHGLRAVAVQCGPDLIKEVAGILVTPDWRASLEARAGSMGIDAINCAVQAVLKSLGDPVRPLHSAATADAISALGYERVRIFRDTGGIVELRAGAHSLSRADLHARSTAWLKDHPVKK